jgi:hypothetical protein
MGLGLMRQVPKVTSGRTRLMMGHWMMWPLPCLPLLENPLPWGCGNPRGMLWKNLVEALQLEPYELAYYYGMGKCFELVGTGHYYVLKSDYSCVHSVDSMDKLADLLDARFWNNPDGQAMASETDKYNQYEIIILAGICGVPGDPSSWRDISLEALPDFWTKIKGMRR